MTPNAIDLAECFTRIHDQWSPKNIAQLNDYHVKLAKIEGPFVWHQHEETDELFLVVHGQLRIELRDGHVDLGPGQLYVVPKGVEHKPVAEKECHIMLIEPAGTINTGDAGGPRTANADEWL